MSKLRTFWYFMTLERPWLLWVFFWGIMIFVLCCLYRGFYMNF